MLLFDFLPIHLRSVGFQQKDQEHIRPGHRAPPGLDFQTIDRDVQRVLPGRRELRMVLPPIIGCPAADTGGCRSGGNISTLLQRDQKQAGPTLFRC